MCVCVTLPGVGLALKLFVVVQVCLNGVMADLSLCASLWKMKGSAMHITDDPLVTL